MHGAVKPSKEAESEKEEEGGIADKWSVAHRSRRPDPARGLSAVLGESRPKQRESGPLRCGVQAGAGQSRPSDPGVRHGHAYYFR